MVNVILYDKNACLGGLGDRIVGLISIKLISNLLHKNFYIFWNKENIRSFFDYSKYDFEIHGEKYMQNNNSSLYHFIDHPKKIKEYLMKSNKFFNELNLFRVNSEISQYLYKNPLFIKKNYFEDIFNEYKKLYTETLKPTPLLLNKVNELTKNKENIIGIQIRCGDVYMIKNKNIKHKTKEGEDIIRKLLQIKYEIEMKFNESYNIFVTTDNEDMIPCIYQCFNNNKVIYDTSQILHIDRHKINDSSSLLKLFTDNYILSKKTSAMYISQQSNFGRIAALSSDHNNIYDLNCKLLDKKNLLSKDENLFL